MGFNIKFLGMVFASSILFSHTVFSQDTKMASPKNPTVESSMKNNQSGPVANQIDQQKEVEALVKNAAEFVKKNGRDKAIIEFGKQPGPFTKGNSYIFMVDYNGTLLTNVNHEDFVNKNVYDLVDQEGVFFVRNEIDLAKKGGGWLQYRWKELNEPKVSCKKSYIVPMEGNYLIGSGYYYAPGPDGRCAP